MNKRQKGYMLQRMVKRYLEECGYDVYNQVGMYKMVWVKRGVDWERMYVAKSGDIFGCDIIAMKDDEIRFIQVSGDVNVKRRLDEFKKWRWCKFVKVELWSYKGKRLWYVREYDIEKKEFKEGYEKIF